MREVLVDVLKQATSLGFIEMLKVTGTEDETKFEAMAGNQDMIFKAHAKKPLAEFCGVFGMAQLSVVKGIAEFSSFKAEGSTTTVKRETRQGRDQPVELTFTDVDGRVASYRFSDADRVPNQPRDIPVNYDVVVQPSKEKIVELQQLTGIFSSIDPIFNVKTVDGELRFYIGEENSANHRTYVVMGKDVGGKIDRVLPWRIPFVMNVLKLVNGNANAKISIAAKGLMLISFETDLMKYNIWLPAKK